MRPWGYEAHDAQHAIPCKASLKDEGGVPWPVVALANASAIQFRRVKWTVLAQTNFALKVVLMK